VNQLKEWQVSLEDFEKNPKSLITEEDSSTPELPVSMTTVED